MELIKWANEKGYTIKLTEPERQELLALLKCQSQAVELDGYTYELEMV